MSYIGQPLKRREDPRLLTGHGSFVDDIQLPDMLYARVLRSPHTHARLKSIDIDADRRLPGVVAVLLGADITGALGDRPTRAMEGEWQVEKMHGPEQPGLARDKVCYVGQPMAVVVGRDRYVARDATDLIEVNYELRPPKMVTDTIETPSPMNPLGIKGVGELLTVAAPAVVANAVLDALSSFGVRHIDTPLTSEKIWHAMHAAHVD